MTQTPDALAGVATIDLGQALGTLLRDYLDGARDVVTGLPGGPRGYQVMGLAGAGACRNQAMIAQSLGIDRTVLTYLLDDLEGAGLVERRPDPVDRRARQVVLTTQGRETWEATAARVREVEREVLGALSDTEAEQFRDLLARLTSSSVPLVHTGDCEVPEP
jgi:DNA-binding MarR family transcriptional regulator